MSLAEAEKAVVDLENTFCGQVAGFPCQQDLLDWIYHRRHEVEPTPLEGCYCDDCTAERTPEEAQAMRDALYEATGAP